MLDEGEVWLRALIYLCALICLRALDCLRLAAFRARVTARNPNPSRIAPARIHQRFISSHHIA